VSNDFWNVVGALLIVTAMLTSHPVKPAVAQRIETQMAMNWAQTAQDICTGDAPCLVPFPIQ